MKLFPLIIAGLLIGTINGLLGAGGGMIAVPALKKLGFEEKNSHATSIAIILPLCVISATIYLYKGYFNLSQVTPYIPAGIIGAIVGAIFLKKIPPKWIRIVFGVILIYSGIKILM